MREKNYPSDVSRERFEQIRPILEQARKRTKPAAVSEASADAGALRFRRCARLRTCSRSPEQQCQERQVDELQAGIEPS
ncbi:hypothetical protein WKH94_04365, partial [Xanthomonas oryzae pv. oryzae]